MPPVQSHGAILQFLVSERESPQFRFSLGQEEYVPGPESARHRETQDIPLSLSLTVSLSLFPGVSLPLWVSYCLTVSGQKQNVEGSKRDRRHEARVAVGGLRAACLSKARRIDPALPSDKSGRGNEPPHTPLSKHTPALAPAVNI